MGSWTVNSVLACLHPLAALAPAASRRPCRLSRQQRIRDLEREIGRWPVYSATTAATGSSTAPTAVAGTCRSATPRARSVRQVGGGLAAGDHAAHPSSADFYRPPPAALRVRSRPTRRARSRPLPSPRAAEPARGRLAGSTEPRCGQSPRRDGLRCVCSGHAPRAWRR